MLPEFRYYAKNWNVYPPWYVRLQGAAHSHDTRTKRTVYKFEKLPICIIALALPSDPAQQVPIELDSTHLRQGQPCLSMY